MEQQGYADARALVDALAPFANGRNYLNFAEKPVDVRASYPARTWRQLAGIRSAVDPKGVFVANHPVPRLYENGVPMT
jgi:FAD/FMN-containing dehydrogenase